MARRSTLDNILEAVSADNSLQEALLGRLMSGANENDSFSSQQVSRADHPPRTTSQSLPCFPAFGTQMYQSGLNSPGSHANVSTGKGNPIGHANVPIGKCQCLAGHANMPVEKCNPPGHANVPDGKCKSVDDIYGPARKWKCIRSQYAVFGRGERLS